MLKALLIYLHEEIIISRATFNTFPSTRRFNSVHFRVEFTLKMLCTVEMMLHGGLIKLLL